MYIEKYKHKKSCLISILVAFCILAMPISVFAAPTIQESTDAAGVIIKSISYLFNPLCALALSCTFVKIVITVSEQESKKAVDFMKSIFIVFIIFNTLGLGLNWVDRLGIENEYKVDKQGIAEVVRDANGAKGAEATTLEQIVIEGETTTSKE